MNIYVKIICQLAELVVCSEPGWYFFASGENTNHPSPVQHGTSSLLQIKAGAFTVDDNLPKSVS